MEILKLYYVNEDYIKFLQTYDDKVPYNKSQTRLSLVLSFQSMNKIFLHLCLVLTKTSYHE